MCTTETNAVTVSGDQLQVVGSEQVFFTGEATVAPPHTTQLRGAEGGVLQWHQIRVFCIQNQHLLP